MSEEPVNVETPVVKEKKKKGETICIGLDVGTMNLVCARSDRPDIGITRNVFLPINEEDRDLITELSNVSYVESGEGELFIIGSDAFNFANVISREVSRPMER